MISASMKATVVALVLALGMSVVFGTALITRDTGETCGVGSDFAFEHAFERAAEAIRPSVVSITSTRWVESGTRSQRGLRQGFEHLFPRGRPGKREGLGSGVIVDAKGYIVSNNHVIAKADVLSVRLWDDRTFDAEVVGTDVKTDLAVIRIDAADLQPARMGSSSSLRVGQWVLAVGSPFGLSQTVTTGIVSAKGRQSIGLAEYEDFIQTDASINRGNSGGPLIDLQGQLVGINTAIASQGGGHEGIGFAIPIDMASGITRSLIEDGVVTRGWMGIAIQDLTPELAATFQYEGTEGILISDILQDGPAASSTLAVGDIIVGIDGKRVASRTALRHRIAALGPECTISVEVFRDGATRMVEIELGAMPGKAQSFATGSQNDRELGLQVSNLSDALRRRLDIDPAVTGAVVTHVRRDSPAARSGVRAGDVILAVQGAPVDSVAEFRGAVRSRGGEETIRLRILRGAARLFLLLRPDA